MGRHRWKWGLSNWRKQTLKECCFGWRPGEPCHNRMQHATKSDYPSSVSWCCSQGQVQRQGCRPTLLRPEPRWEAWPLGPRAQVRDRLWTGKCYAGGPFLKHCPLLVFVQIPWKGWLLLPQPWSVLQKTSLNNSLTWARKHLVKISE